MHHRATVFLLLCVSACAGSAGSTPSGAPVAAPIDTANAGESAWAPSPADIHPLIVCSLGLEYSMWEEPAEDCARLREAVGIPDAVCGPFLLSPREVNRFAELSLVDERTQCEASRCVAWLVDNEGAYYPLHFWFEEENDVTAVHLGAASELQDEIPPRPSELAPPECAPSYEALRAQSAAEEFWRIEGTEAPTYTATRICGSSARESVARLGVDWLCEDHYCETAMCSTRCRSVSTMTGPGGSPVVIGEFDGMEYGRGIPLDPERLAALRARVECGQSAVVRRAEFAVPE